jgi:predicted DNA-binding transcriptional regulator AlpA
MEEYWTWKEVSKIVRFARQHVHYLESDKDKEGNPKTPTFPKRIKIGARRVVWKARAIMAWLGWREQIQRLVEDASDGIKPLTYAQAERMLPPPDFNRA